jgi:hypothetical protein
VLTAYKSRRSPFCHTARLNIPEDCELHTRRRENLKSHLLTCCFCVLRSLPTRYTLQWVWIRVDLQKKHGTRETPSCRFVPPGSTLLSRTARTVWELPASALCWWPLPADSSCPVFSYITPTQLCSPEWERSPYLCLHTEYEFTHERV